MAPEAANATTAECYGWVNRALPDAESKPYVDALAQRIASLPAAGVQAIKERINAISLAGAADYMVDSDLFGKGASEPETQSRLRALFQAGMQTRGDVEMNFGKKLGELGSAYYHPGRTDSTPQTDPLRRYALSTGG